MATLYHLSLCPFSRLARLALGEKKVNVSLVSEKYWEERPAFIELNPAGTLPVLVEEGGMVIPGIYPLIEYLEDAYPQISLMTEGASSRVEVRRLISWVNEKFYNEVTHPILWEKVFKRVHKIGWADSKIIRKTLTHLGYHLEYFTYLLEKRDYLGGNRPTYADFALAAHLSCIDFLSFMSWEKYPTIKAWYSLLKSRPCFRPLLFDQFPGVHAPPHYNNIDF